MMLQIIEQLSAQDLEQIGEMSEYFQQLIKSGHSSKTTSPPDKPKKNYFSMQPVISHRVRD